MNITDFKSQVAAYANRPLGDFVLNNQDLLLLAINRAKRAAQRDLDFVLCEAQVDVTVDLVNGGSLSTAVLHGTSTPADVNKLFRGWLTIGVGQRPVDLVTRNEIYRRLGSSWDANVPWQQWIAQSKQVIPCDTPSLVRYSNLVYVWPPNAAVFNGVSSTLASFDCTTWLPDYTQTVLQLDVASEATPTVNGSYPQVGYYMGQPLFKRDTLPTFFVWFKPGVSSNWVISTALELTNPSFLLTGTTTYVGTYTAAGIYSGTADVVVHTGSDGAVASDFLLDRADDWMLYRSLRELNFLLKDADRIPVTAAALSEAWQSVKDWNSSLEQPDTFNLD